MGISENVRETTANSLALFVLLGISFSVNIAGFGSGAWLEYTLNNVQPIDYFSCDLWGCSTYNVSNTLDIDERAAVPNHAGWFRAVQAMIVMGFLATLVSLLLIAAFVLMAKVKSRVIALGLAMACFVAVLFDLIGVAVFRSTMADGKVFRVKGNSIFDHSISWGFYMTCAGMVMYLVSGIGAIILMREMRQSSCGDNS